VVRVANYVLGERGHEESEHILFMTRTRVATLMFIHDYMCYL